MCMEDVRLGRESGFNVIPIRTPPGIVVPLFGGAEQRTAIILGAPQAGLLTYSTKADVTTTNGLNLGPGQFPIILTVKDHGKIVQQPWFVVDDGTQRNAQAIEVLLARE